MDKIPTSLDEAIDILKELNINSKKINGMVMRNSWGLWRGSKLAQWFYKRQIYHADDMSGIIIESYQKSIEGKDIELDKQISKYHKHWENAYGKDHLSIMKGHIIEQISKMRNEDINEILNSIDNS